MNLLVADYSDSKSKSNQRRQPSREQNSPLWNLDDTRPAGPYRASIDDDGLRLICLATIRQALMDVRSSRNPEVVLRARQFLASRARDWLRAMQIYRRGENEQAYNLIFHGSLCDLLWPEEENDEPGGCYDDSKETP